MSAIIRSARPGDADFLAWTILAAGRAHLPRGWYDIALGLPHAECLVFLRHLVMTATPSWWRYDRFIVAELDGAPVAALCAFGAADYAGSEAAMAEAGREMGWTEAALAGVWTRGAYVFTCSVGEAGTDVWTVENVATAPAHRGQGLAGALLDEAMDRGRAAGFHKAQISFVIGNGPAERAYAKAGFALVNENRHPDFEAATGSPGLRRFTRAL